MVLLRSTKILLFFLIVNKKHIGETVQFDEKIDGVCNNNTFSVCIRKCCANQEVMLNETCINSDESFLNLTFYEMTDAVDIKNVTFIYTESMCPDGMMPFQLENDDPFYVQLDGTLYVPDYTIFVNNKIPVNQYCVDNFVQQDNTYKMSAVFCVEPFEEPHTAYYNAGMIISMPFLLATLIVYALLPERNLHMKALMFYVFSLLMAYICLVILQLNTKEIPKTECQVIAFFTFFFFMASFFWMNVICLDIWFTFSGLRGFNGSKRSAERKRLLFYCAYAWGLTIALSTTVFLINNLGNAGAWYHPNIGNGRCWFEHDYQQLFYFYGPMAALIFANVVLFCLTAYKIRQSQNETKMLRRDDSKRHAAESDQQKFYLYMKLFLAMGVNWTMEFLSWIIEWKVQAETKYMFYVTDFCNAIYGVFIFFLFVCKMKIWCLLKKRYYTFMGKPYFARETTLRTHSSNFSGTESTMFSDNDHNRDSRPLRLNSMK